MQYEMSISACMRAGRSGGLKGRDPQGASSSRVACQHKPVDESDSVMTHSENVVCQSDLHRCKSRRIACGGEGSLRNLSQPVHHAKPRRVSSPEYAQPIATAPLTDVSKCDEAIAK